MVGEDEVGLQDGQRLGVRVGAGLVDDDVERPAVVLHARHLHVLFDGGGWREVWGGRGSRSLTDKTRVIVEMVTLPPTSELNINL